MKKLLALFLLLASLTSYAKAGKSFAIIIDKTSYENCKRQVNDYASSVKSFDAFISAQEWINPEQVRDSIRTWYKTRHLAGVVFIGDIPVAMVRKAQHLASAFKMDEKAFPKRDSSIPSDRFYDDFGLKFDYIGRDSTETNFFYYNLDPESAQEVSPDIFSGRIKPSSNYQDKYSELSKYLEKIVRVKSETNKLDRVSSYTGYGSFSNSMIAWKDETVTLREQVPDAFKNIDGAQFFVFYQYPFMKDVMMKEAGQPDLDLLLYHHHGTPERQWIGEYPGGSNDDEYYAIAKMQARNVVRTRVRYGATRKEAMKQVMETYGLDSTWVCDTFNPKISKADSIEDLKTGIELDDIHNAKPNVRMLIFDACYNGDFRENDNVANRYIMSDGKSIAALGNSVNVLQDKASSTLLGMLTAGYTVGEWNQMSAIMESTIIGDPTFAFTPVYDFQKPDISVKNAGYWKKYLKKSYPCDIQGLAL
ncbi:MAG: C25 family cysteine peptidase, partial [Bacteroidales bacterium]|nr:C25 family cysteine peptidase [Bacteroidales bacterium]